MWSSQRRQWSLLRECGRRQRRCQARAFRHCAVRCTPSRIGASQRLCFRIARIVDDRMPALTSQIDPRSQDFLDNAAWHRQLVDELDRRLARAADGGGEKARAKHTERGKLLPRERIDALLDPGAPFLEIAPLAAEGMYDDAAPAAGMVCGIGALAGGGGGDCRRR